MEVRRGEIWWIDLPAPTGSAPGGTRPFVVIQSDGFNRSAINTVIVAAMTTNLRLAGATGNVLVPVRETGLTKPSVVNVSQLLTVDRSDLRSKAGKLRQSTLEEIGRGLRLALGLDLA